MTEQQTLAIRGGASAPERQLTLKRPHTPASSPLRAWSSADELALNELADTAATRLLIVNDEFGALACGFAHREPTIWLDSALSHDATQSNLAANKLEPIGDRFVAGNASPTGPFDLVVIRLPRSLALLEWQLQQIALVTEPGTPVVGVGMARHIQRSTRECFERMIGETEVSQATRKARLIHAVRSPATPPDIAPMANFTLGDGTIVAQRPGVFSAGHIDVGTALLLEHIEDQSASHTLDLGCGNGVIAASLARRHTTGTFTLLDASDLAIAAATDTWAANGLDTERATMIVADGARAVAANSVDMVVTNPPFHQGYAVDDQLAERLLADAARTIQPDGRLLAVGQRDLHLHTRLRRWFGHVRVVSKHPVFVVVEAIEPK